MWVPMLPVKILVGQPCLVVLIVASGLWASTQWAAALGRPAFHPWRPLVWWIAYAPVVFRGAGILAPCSVLAETVAMADLRWRTRKMKIVTTRGSAKLATAKEIEASNLVGGYDMILGMLGSNSLPDDGLDRPVFVDHDSGIGRCLENGLKDIVFYPYRIGRFTGIWSLGHYDSTLNPKAVEWALSGIPMR
jgi:type IV secretory pathway TraG/TraD family ATPase VirD4